MDGPTDLEQGPDEKRCGHERAFVEWFLTIAFDDGGEVAESIARVDKAAKPGRADTELRHRAAM
ncbi:hypothetical protein [Paenibacillus methanolicus]|uniref:Uncharacterized protein n=1 Tax=Paenibacillus methanolicus TaxID=582686 RepID=A0A5S5CIW6_9BACL|nr:hypothetical protein [Paenibacillus methanolicus]TYP79690.1 hypothetical protein BCM02_101811 [Paenibacillus methanolicus]